MIKWKVDPDDEFEKALKTSFKALGDLTAPYKLMTKQWFKGNRSIFDLGRQGPGKYDDLSPQYEDQKFREVGFVYPILVKSGKLMRSMVQPDNKDSVNLIVNKKILVLGTKVVNDKGKPYPIFLQKGSKKIGLPARPFVLLGGEQVATRGVNERRKAWIKTLESFVIQKSEGFAK